MLKRFVFRYSVLISLRIIASAKNYPYTDGPKPCSRKMAATQLVASICIPSPTGWKQDSVNNCWQLKDTCPEFNRAECVWFTLAGSCATLQFPACRLSYRAAKWTAQKYDWMEIFYTNQYGTSERRDGVFDIVELHRRVRNEEAFYAVEQPDWPQNVANPQAERGLNWYVVNKHKLPTNISLCKPDNAASIDRCSKEVISALQTQYPEGFDKSKVPHFYIRDHMNDKGTKLYTTVQGNCSLALIGGLKTDVCRVTYIQKFEYMESNPVTLEKRFLEVQVYHGKSEAALDMRYAYLPAD